ncbi:hypothetical protein AB0C60_30855, partial [Streptomyces sp. NPDC048845]
MAGNSEPLSPRAKLAVTAGRAAAAASRAVGRGSGSVIGGKVALRLPAKPPWKSGRRACSAWPAKVRPSRSPTAGSP